MKTTVIHHSADFDGIFCREIARKFLPDAELIGWDFKDEPIPIPDGKIYILDLPVDRVFGFNYRPEDVTGKPPQHPAGLVWIDHHKSSIESHPVSIPGYRIDGVAACRLAWQWFYLHEAPATIWPDKTGYVERRVREPLAVRLAGEYDIWDKRDPRAETFQFGLRSQEISPEIWECLLSSLKKDEDMVDAFLKKGELLQKYQQNNDAGTMYRSFMVSFEGLNFLALNTARCNSLTFATKDIPETGHDALMGFYFDGSNWNVSLYHANHRKDLDLSLIAVKHGGGGHRGACGFKLKNLPGISKLPFISA